jgi:hypothetical protein
MVEKHYPLVLKKIAKNSIGTVFLTHQKMFDHPAITIAFYLKY